MVYVIHRFNDMIRSFYGMGRMVSALLVLFSMVTPAAAQPALPVQLDVDQSVFALDAEHSLVELYFGFGIKPEQFQQNDQGYGARLPLQVTLASSSGEPAWSDSTVLNFVVADTAGLSAGSSFLHQIRAPLTPGAYELRVTIPRDERSGRQELQIRRAIEVPSFGESGKAAISDLTLASSVQPGADRNDPFYRNGLVVRPNAGLLYGKGLPQLFYYAETYNAGTLGGGDGQYTVRVYVTGANGTEPAAGLVKQIEREVRSPDVLVGSFDLAGLSTGAYVLHLALMDDTGKPTLEETRKFFVFNPDVAAAGRMVDMTFEGSPYATMPESEVKIQIEHLDALATERERRRLRNLTDLDDQRRFLMDFWNKRNPVPGSAVNTFKEEFYRRLHYANERYSSGPMQGWKTDRGRTLIKYGSPTNIDPHLYERDLLPHEIWRYDNIPGEGESIFVFADRNGFGQFELVHSNVAGERSLPDWEQELIR